MTSKNISIAILDNRFEVAMFEGSEIVGELVWAFTPDQVADAVKKLLTPQDAPATCVCGCALDADGKCPLELNAAALSLVEPAVSDDDTEELTPVWAEPMVDQPSFPHDEAFARWMRGSKEFYLSSFGMAADYMRTWRVSDVRLARAAVKHILSQQS